MPKKPSDTKNATKNATSTATGSAAKSAAKSAASSIDDDATALLQTLEQRFADHPERHGGVDWAAVHERLRQRPQALAALQAMEASGGEPDVVTLDGEAAGWCFVDCAPESPTGRRSLCYDDAALAARKEHRPAGSAFGLAEEMGVQMLTEAQYHALQRLGEFDLKTSSWVQAPPEIREQQGGLFCDRRFGRVFTYHNGVQSYYASRGFRAMLSV